MTSKGEKLRRHRASQGRPRRQGVERYENGKINYSTIRAETETEVKAVAVGARRRVHGFNDDVPVKVVESPYAGYTLGRIFLDGNITQDERKAGDEYALAMARYYNLLGVSPSVRAQEIFRVSGYGGEVTEDFQRAMRRASNTMMYYEGVLLQCRNGQRVKSTVYEVCVMDREALRHMPASQLDLLKAGLQAIGGTMTCTKARIGVA